MGAWDSRNNNFDFMRLAFAVLVIYSHGYPLGLGTEVAEPFIVATHGQLTGGAIAVDSFFVMSGFLIAASALRSSTIWSFLKKRISRIYPAFLLAALLTLILFLPLSGGRLARHAVFDVISQTLKLSEFHYSGALTTNPFPSVINGSLWSIKYEFFCYLGVALLTVATLLRRRFAVLALLLGAWVVSIIAQVQHWTHGGKFLGTIFGSPQFWARLLPLYLAGVVFYLFRDRIPLRAWLAAVCGLVLVAGCFFSAGITATFPFAGTYLLFWFAFSPAIRLHHFGRFGDFSYGTYLYAFPIEQLIVRAFAHPVAPLRLFLMATPLSLLAAAISWYGVERRFLQPVRRHELPTKAIEEKLAAT